MARSAEETDAHKGSDTASTATEDVAETDGAATVEGAATSTTTDDRYVTYTLDATHASLYGADVGTVVKRKDYILKRWGDKVSRSDIAKELTALSTAQGGKKVPYQIVFQATSKVPGGPDKTAPAPTDTTDAASSGDSVQAAAE
jgi:hypothetical protein